jgi:hypothetical protein
MLTFLPDQIITTLFNTTTSLNQDTDFMIVVFDAT